MLELGTGLPMSSRGFGPLLWEQWGATVGLRAEEGPRSDVWGWRRGTFEIQGRGAGYLGGRQELIAPSAEDERQMGERLQRESDGPWFGR